MESTYRAFVEQGRVLCEQTHGEIRREAWDQSMEVNYEAGYQAGQQQGALWSLVVVLALGIVAGALRRWSR